MRSRSGFAQKIPIFIVQGGPSAHHHFVGFVRYPEHYPGDGLGTVAGDGAGVYPLGVFSCLGQQTTRIFGPQPLPELRELGIEAGFGNVRRVPLDNPFNNLYELTP